MRPRNATLTSWSDPDGRSWRACRGAALALLLAMPLPAAAQAGFEAGLDAFLRADYAAAVTHWQALASVGHAQSAFNLGRMHELGQGVNQDDAAAARWFRSAAERGHPGAQHSLGQIYAEGRGGLDDPIEAYLWLALASLQAAPETPAARMLALQRAALLRRLTPTQLDEAEAALASWSLRRD